MKFKSLSVLAVTIAGIAMISAACQAPSSQTKDGSGSPQAQNVDKPDNPPPSGLGSNGSMQGVPPSLKLTDAQKTKMKEIQESYRSKMENILSDKQKNELKAAREQGKGRTAMQSINLTDTQKQQLKDLRQSQRQEIDGVLTNEQKQQLQEMRQKRQQMPNHGDMPEHQAN